MANADTGTNSAVAGTVSDSTTILAANTRRVGATIFNDSSAILYLSLGAVATTSSHTIQLAAQGYFEAPYGYIGVITGRWATAVGNARVTELV